jgi:hypothetical protein
MECFSICWYQWARRDTHFTRKFLKYEEEPCEERVILLVNDKGKRWTGLQYAILIPAVFYTPGQIHCAFLLSPATSVCRTVCIRTATVQVMPPCLSRFSETLATTYNTTRRQNPRQHQHHYSCRKSRESHLSITKSDFFLNNCRLNSNSCSTLFS